MVKKLKREKKGFGQFTRVGKENVKSLLEGIPQEILENYKIFSLGYIAWKCFRKHGRGICVYIQKKPFSYLNDPRLMPDIDKALFDFYNPQKEFLVTAPFDDDVDVLWATQNISYSDKKSQLRIVFPKEKSLQTFIDDCLL